MSNTFGTFATGDLHETASPRNTTADNSFEPSSLDQLLPSKRFDFRSKNLVIQTAQMSPKAAEPTQIIQEDDYE
jgi:hypothetical protein